MIVKTDGMPLAVVTGAASGMGLATARRLVADGYSVAALDIDWEGLQTLAHESAGSIIPYSVDFSDLPTVEGCLGEIIADLGPPSALVNNAGIALVATLLDQDFAAWQRVIDVNLSAPFLVSRAVVPSMIENGGGAIVNVASVCSFVGAYARAAYCASKAGIMGLTRSIAADFATSGIRVNAICPGTVETNYTKHVLAEAEDPVATRAFMTDRQLIGRMGTPEEIADTIAFLLSPAASFFHGSAVIVDGGMTVI